MYSPSRQSASVPSEHAFGGRRPQWRGESSPQPKSMPEKRCRVAAEGVRTRSVLHKRREAIVSERERNAFANAAALEREIEARA